MKNEWYELNRKALTKGQAPRLACVPGPVVSFRGLVFFRQQLYSSFSVAHGIIIPISRIDRIKAFIFDPLPSYWISRRMIAKVGDNHHNHLLKEAMQFSLSCSFAYLCHLLIIT
jgi:hypothetical protein